MPAQLSLKDAAKVLAIPAYRINYSLANGLVEEPKLRIAGRRIFQADDLRRLAKHFGVEVREGAE